MFDSQHHVHSTVYDLGVNHLMLSPPSGLFTSELDKWHFQLQVLSSHTCKHILTRTQTHTCQLFWYCGNMQFCKLFSAFLALKGLLGRDPSIKALRPCIINQSNHGLWYIWPIGPGGAADLIQDFLWASKLLCAKSCLQPTQTQVVWGMYI